MAPQARSALIGPCLRTTSSKSSHGPYSMTRVAEDGILSSLMVRRAAVADTIFGLRKRATIRISEKTAIKGRVFLGRGRKDLNGQVVPKGRDVQLEETQCPPQRTRSRSVAEPARPKSVTGLRSARLILREGAGVTALHPGPSASA